MVAIWHLSFSVVLFDNWFLRLRLVQAIEDAHKDWVGGCPKDRLVLFQNRWTHLLNPGTSASPAARMAVLTVRLPGARMVPMTNTWTLIQVDA